MRKITTIAFVSVLLLAFGSTVASAGGLFGPKGDGIGNMFNYFFQWLRDNDGDGIPNCLDPDWVRPEDGTGYGKHNGAGDCSGDCDGTGDRDRKQVRLRSHDGLGINGGSCISTRNRSVYGR